MTTPSETLRGARGFTRLWTASTTSAFGSYVTILAVQVLVVDVLAGDAFDVGLVNAARWLPYLLFGLLVGVLVDRMRRRPLLVATDLLSAVALAAVPVLSVLGHLNVAWLIGIMFVFGLCRVVGDAAFQSFVPRLVHARLLGPAHARIDQSDAVAQASGPALAGGLVSWLGAPVAVLVDALSYLVSALLIATVRVDEGAPRTALRARGIGSEIGEGLRWIYRHATLRPLAISTHLWFVCSAVAGAVMTPFALRTLHLSPATLGLALALAGVGALVGASMAVGLGRRLGAGRVIITARVGTGLAWVLMAAAPLALPEGPTSGPWGGGTAWVVFAAGQLVLGLCMGSENANEMAYQQTATPDRLQGRMSATKRSINRAMIVVAAPLGGLLGDAAGYGTALTIAGAGLVVTAVVTLGSGLRDARLGDEHTGPAERLSPGAPPR
ncbi:MFS transporter [Cellulomonas sp. PhB150]|uniref:MFS transporter n=1 Tax=Cellulomonas sp. PhB150 TaxID=2485188 RepID=UPI000F47B5FC|nr:MFS transporter [Cellulomonas sp. PhB150]ROS23997.1 putative MFS family arabinose efflux permease [Cellulomonas sp. PhB150]